MRYALWLVSALSGIGGFAIIGTARDILGEVDGAILLAVSIVFCSVAVIVHAIERRP